MPHRLRLEVGPPHHHRMALRIPIMGYTPVEVAHIGVEGHRVGPRRRHPVSFTGSMKRSIKGSFAGSLPGSLPESLPRLLAGLLGAALMFAAAPCLAVQVNLAAVSCAKYENEVLTSELPGYSADPIDTVMWLFGFATGKAGERVMYGDSLRAFGFALDTECKDNPTTSLLNAVSAVNSKRENPMDLTRLDCATFTARHVALRKSDPESAHTLTMWLFGFSTGLSGSHILDPDGAQAFDAALERHCTDHPKDSVFDALNAGHRSGP